MLDFVSSEIIPNQMSYLIVLIFISFIKQYTFFSIFNALNIMSFLCLICSMIIVKLSKRIQFVQIINMQQRKKQLLIDKTNKLIQQSRSAQSILYYCIIAFNNKTFILQFHFFLKLPHSLYSKSIYTHKLVNLKYQNQFLPPSCTMNEEKFQFTRDEIKNIEKAMKNPEFHNLLGDYMMEISDPKNKAEYDQYLKQLENEKELPKNMKLLQPSPEFAIKTHISLENASKFTEKIFINICSHELLEEPTCQIVTKDGVPGQNWRLPYSVSKLRYDQDNQKKVVNTVDVVFHTKTFSFIQKEEMKRFVCETAIQGVEKLLLERKQKISKDYIIFQKMKCKGDTPALLPVNVSQLPSLKHTAVEDERNFDSKTKLEKELNEKKKQAQANTQTQAEEEDIEENLDAEKETQNKSAQKIIKHSNGLTIPFNKIKYTYPVVMGDYFNSDREERARRIPTHITLDIELPGVTSVSQIKLDANKSSVILKVEELYYLEKDLFYTLDESKTSAKFDKKSQTLKLVFPVIGHSKLELATKLVSEKWITNMDIPTDNDLQNEEKKGVNLTTSNELLEKETDKNLILPDAQLPQSESVSDKITRLVKFDDIKNTSEEAQSGLEKNQQEVLENLAVQNRSVPQKEIIFYANSDIEKKDNQNIRDIQLIEEIQSIDNKNEFEIPVEQNAENKITMNYIQTKTSETSSHIFLLANIPNYIKEHLDYVQEDNQILIQHSPSSKIIETFWVKILQPNYISVDSIEFVTNYIVIKLKKHEEKVPSDSYQIIEKSKCEFDEEKANITIKKINQIQESSNNNAHITSELMPFPLDKNNNEEVIQNKIDKEDENELIITQKTKVDEKKTQKNSDSKVDATARKIQLIKFECLKKVFELDQYV